MKEKASIMDFKSVQRAITRISHEILERNKGTEDLVIVGICNKGMPIAKTISENIKKIEGVQIPVYELNVTQYRDDMKDKDLEISIGKLPEIDVTDKKIILVDDVLYTGRTVRAALDALIDMGRPTSIQLAVLVDRGHRELPIRADYVGKNVPTSRNEIIKVSLDKDDDKAGVLIFEK